MASTTVERIGAFPRGESMGTLLKRASIALRDTIQHQPALPSELEERINRVRQMPNEQIDLQLLLLVDGTADREVDGKLPPSLVALISQTAHKTLEIFPENAHTEQTLSGIARAADDTGEHELLEIALAIATAHDVPDGGHPHLREALRQSAEGDVSFRDAYKSLQTPQPPIGAPVYGETARRPVGQDVPQASIDEYEWLFDPSARRPSAQ